MSHKYHFRIADVAMCIESDLDMRFNDELALFESQENAKFAYKCQWHSSLPLLPENENIRYYFDHIRNRHYAVTQEQADRMSIHLLKSDLPWGSELEQLYTLIAMPHTLLRHKKLVLHASYIVTEQGAIIFTAPSGTGKSTQAELWKAHRNATIVNGDRAVIGLDNGIPKAYGYPLSGSSQYCLNHTANLRAIVSLKQSPENTIKRLTGFEQILILINGSFLPQEYAADLPLVIDTADEISTHVPVLQLSCRPDEDAVRLLESTLSDIEKQCI